MCCVPVILLLFIAQFKVLLFNDNGNTREYVSRSLVQVVGMPEDKAFYIMQQVTIRVVYTSQKRSR